MVNKDVIKKINESIIVIPVTKIPSQVVS